MFKKPGLPEVGELVLCTVKRITPHSAFVELDEYGIEGMLHINEISLKGVKNIKDHLHIGKKIVCLVINVDKGFVDVSLKRVSSGETKRKLNEIRAEKRFYKLLEHVCGEKADDIALEFHNKYGSLANAFNKLKEEGLKIFDGISIPKEFQEDLMKEFKELIEQLKVKIKRLVKVKTYESDGIERIKKVLSSVKDYPCDFTYLGSGKFQINIEAMNYKKAEEYFNKIKEILLNKGKELNVEVKFGE